jgi:toxin-antitoxin system PIN domain toxin
MADQLRFLFDVNVVMALTQAGHVHHSMVKKWFTVFAAEWGMCALSESGFLRLSVNPKVGNLSVEDANRLLDSLTSHPNYRYWPIQDPWYLLAPPRFGDRIFGHQQITDAYLLGLACKHNGVLVTLDKRIQYLAGEHFSKNVLVLQ